MSFRIHEVELNGEKSSIQDTIIGRLGIVPKYSEQILRFTQDDTSLVIFE